jgi:DNA phosphorothioation-dependent restriction protein DptG
MVEMRGNFDQDFAPETTLPLLLNMAVQGKLSSETLFAEMQRRGVISDEYSWADELERIEQQGPSLGAM